MSSDNGRELGTLSSKIEYGTHYNKENGTLFFVLVSL